MNNTLKTILKLSITNMLMFVCVFSVYSFDNPPSNFINSLVYIDNFDSKEEEVEKLVANVKVAYNPVVQQINVSFKLTKQSNVSIKLMDALGNEVLNLLPSTSLESGNQNHSFDTSDKIAAGFYFVRVSTGVETVVKRISIRL